MPRSSTLPALLVPTFAAALLAAGCAKVPPVEPTVASAHHMNDYEHYQQAADSLQPIIDATPGIWQVEYEYGRAKAGMGDLPTARRSLERAAARVPENTEVVFALADVMAKQKDAPKLYELLRNAGTQLRSSEAWVKLAVYADQLGDPDTAMGSIKAAIEVDDGFDVRRGTECYYQAYLLETRWGAKEEAIRRLRQACGINPEDPRVRLALQQNGIQPGAAAALPAGV